jgi:hypothetical protein
VPAAAGTAPPIVPIPGLSQTITVAANSTILMSTDGGFAAASSQPGDAVVVDIFLLDRSATGTVILAERRYVANNGPVFLDNKNWSFTFAQALAPGVHTIFVGAALSGSATSPGQSSNAIVAGTPLDLNRGILTVAQINR